MEIKPSSTVTQLPTRNRRGSVINQSISAKSTVTARPKNTKLGKTVVHGLSLLISGQRQFAEEFGLSSARVFPQSHHLLDGQSPDKCLKKIFRSGEPGIIQLQEIFNDMIEHQLALFSAIDAVAKEALTSLSPNIVQDENPSYLATNGSKWRFYKRYHKEFQVNDSFRFNMIVAPGFIKK